jgi:predicted DNA-binding transcriptional regulator YafY
MGKKWSEAGPAEKILLLYSMLLFSQKKWSLKQLTDKLGCSKSSVLRLIDQLEAADWGKVLKTKEGRESFYEFDRPIAAPKLSLNAEGLHQLALCRDFIWHLLPEDMRKNLEATLTQASAFVPPDPEDEGFPAGRAQFKGRIDYTPFQDFYQGLIKAIRQGKICAVTYQNTLTQPPQVFDYAPKQLYAYHESIRLSGWMVDEKNKAKHDRPTYLALQRFKDLKITDRSAKRLPEPPVRNDGAFGLMEEEPFQAMLAFTAKTSLYVKEREWSRDQRLEIRPDGGLTLTLTAQSRPELLKWILSFGREAKILAPDWLRQAVREEIAALAELYPET